VAEHVPPSLAFRGTDLRSVLLPATAGEGSGRVLAVELYRDGLIVRGVIAEPQAVAPASTGVPLFVEQARFVVTDDRSTSYTFAGSVSGGTPCAHLMAMFTPAPPTDAQWLDVASHLGRARFELRTS
jgi:hypothetical protein